MNRTDRLYALVEELRAVAPGSRSAARLASRFEVSVRTIHSRAPAISGITPAPGYRASSTVGKWPSRNPYGVVWAEGALAAKLKELAYLRVSILNGCGY
jgi:Carboxymuconolactone decarboxylase family